MGIVRSLRDRHLASVSDAESLWRPREDVPPIVWHAAHASLFTAITLCGMGRGDWSFATAEELRVYNVNAMTPGTLPPLSALSMRIPRWDAASDAVAAGVRDGELEQVLPHRKAEWLPETCRTWRDAMLYMVTHEPFHHGEIGVLRRLAGHPRVE
jgi:hypothetical protein